MPEEKFEFAVTKRQFSNRLSLDMQKKNSDSYVTAANKIKD